MAVFLELIDMDKEWENVKDRDILINDLEIIYEEDKTRFEILIYSTINDKTLASVPRCSWGCTTGAVSVGTTCIKCGTVVRELVNDFKPDVWIERPLDAPPFMLPYVYIVLSQIKLHGISLLEFLLNKNYTPTIRNTQEKYYQLLDYLVPLENRNYTWLTNNFFVFFHQLMERLKVLEGKRKTKHEELDAFYQNFVLNNADKIFVEHLPIINKALLSREKSSKGIYVLQETPDLVDAILQIINIEPTFSTAKIAKRVQLFIENSSVFYYNFMKNMIDTKGGISRKNRCGARMPFSFRTVVSSITEPHNYLEIHMPWFAAVETFRPIIVNRLKRQGYQPREIERIIVKAFYEYNPIIDVIFQEMIDSSPDLGIPILSNRNPTIGSGSIMKLYCTKVKTDVTDVTTSISIQIVTPPNCDFDGDELNFYFLPDLYTSSLMNTLRPERNIMDTYMPFEIAGSFTIPKPVNAVMNTFLAVHDHD